MSYSRATHVVVGTVHVVMYSPWTCNPQDYVTTMPIMYMYMRHLRLCKIYYLIAVILQNPNFHFAYII